MPIVQGKPHNFEAEYRMLHQDHSYLLQVISPRGDGHPRCSGSRSFRMAGSLTDITRGKAVDPLTGLPNRGLVHGPSGCCRQGHSESSRSGVFAVLFLDLDRFKVVNDSLGHLAGDELLVEVAKRLEVSLRSSDVISRVNDRTTISRFGGDEFVILLKGILRNQKTPVTLQIAFLAALSKPLSLRGQRRHVSLPASELPSGIGMTTRQAISCAMPTRRCIGPRHSESRVGVCSINR